MTKRVAAFIDGFNFYHAVKDLNQPHLKWVNLWNLCSHFAPKPNLNLVKVFYFSAYALWRPDSYKRHKAFVKALESTGVTTVMANFKEKDRKCFKCNYKWIDHEEKQTDVDLALHLLAGAWNDEYDLAFLLTADSDITPAVRMVKNRFPDKTIRVFAPPGRKHSKELGEAVGKNNLRRLKTIHLEQFLFGAEIFDKMGNCIAVRPVDYNPPL